MMECVCPVYVGGMFGVFTTTTVCIRCGVRAQLMYSRCTHSQLYHLLHVVQEDGPHEVERAGLVAECRATEVAGRLGCPRWQLTAKHAGGLSECRSSGRPGRDRNGAVGSCASRHERASEREQAAGGEQARRAAGQAAWQPLGVHRASGGASELLVLPQRCGGRLGWAEAGDYQGGRQHCERGERDGDLSGAQPLRRGLRFVCVLSRGLVAWGAVAGYNWMSSCRLATCVWLQARQKLGPVRLLRCVMCVCSYLRLTCGWFSFSFFQLILEGDTRSSTSVVSGRAQ